MNAPAYRADGAAVERATFYALACDPRRSVVVEACAGAGKTWMLVSRILRALLDGAQPSEILAITFTRKAAGEMRNRLDEWLRDFAAPGTTNAAREAALRERGVPAAQAAELAPRLAALPERLLEDGRPVEIRTFHAWFAQLLRSAPLELLEELGLQPDAELIERFDDHLPALRRRFHAALLADPDLRADHVRLIAQRGRNQAQKWFDTVLERRVEFALADRAGVLEGSVAPAPAGWHDQLPGLVRTLAAGQKKARDVADNLAGALADPDPAMRVLAVWQALSTDAGELRKLGTVPGLDAVYTAAEQELAYLEHQRMVRLARVLLVEHAAYKHARGLMDMNDLELGALALLRDTTLSGWVQERLDARLRHVLIDEFQDTSPLQWQALHAWLSSYAGAGGGASGRLAPAVFIVGDPKQSIYRFRRADPRVFLAAREFVVSALGGSVLECDHTRRNTPEVLAGVNAVFTAAQDVSEFTGFRAHTTEIAPQPGPALRRLPRVPRPPKATAAAAAAAPWRDSLTTARHEPEEVLRAAEAAQVADAIRALLDEGTQPGEIMLLCRKRESLRLAAQALLERHVPFAAVEDIELGNAPEALDLIAVLDALASPQHRLSLARALRCPLFGAADADLLALARRAGTGGDWWSALVETDWDSAALQRARALLPGWQQAQRALPPHDLLDRIVGEGELRERLAASVPPERRIAALDSVDAVLAQSLALDAGRYATPYGFVRALRRRVVNVPAPTLAAAVQLLTVHGAKGLEADIVFVLDADPEAKRTETTTLLVDWPVDAAHPRRCAFVYNENRCSPDLQALLASEQAAREREELNGLYVAMTRARHGLVFSATEPYLRAPGTSWWQRIESLAPEWVPEPAAPPAVLSGPMTVTIDRLPRWGGAGEIVSRAAVGSPDTDATRLGKAVHRMLEWHTAAAGDATALATAAAAEFGAPPVEVERLGRVILDSPACARFFGGPTLRWAGNEVPFSLAGETLRIDRLVLLDDMVDEPVWWVLDYKLQHRPQELPAYHEQLARYRAAVQQAQPGARVRSAFIAGDGSVIESG